MKCFLAFQLSNYCVIVTTSVVTFAHTFLLEDELKNYFYEKNNVLMFYAADYLSFHFHFRAYNCAAFSKMNRVV